MRAAFTVLAMLAVVLYFNLLPLMAQRGRSGGGQPSGGPAMGMPDERPQRGPMHEGMGRGDRSEKTGSPMGHPEKGRMGGEQRTTQTQKAERTEQLTVPDQLAQNEKLSAKLQEILPEGTNLQEAASGFKNLGQFVAAAHVSHNLGIPFDDLTTKMISGQNLGEAIHELRPDVDHNAEARKAEAQSKKDLAETRRTEAQAKKGIKEPGS